MLRGAPSNNTKVCDTKSTSGTMKNPRSHLVIYLGEETMVTSSQLVPGGTVQLIVGIKCVGRVQIMKPPEEITASQNLEVWAQSKTPNT
jgi:hypothetical protein